MLVPFGNRKVEGYVLNVKNDITQKPDETGYVPENTVLGGYFDSQEKITINGNGHTINGGGYDGFKMTSYNSGECGREATINNATLTNFSKKNYYIDVISIEGPYENGDYTTLTLNDVNIVNNDAGIYMYGNAMLNINSSNNVRISSNTGGIVNNGTINFKGNNIHIADTPVENNGEMYNDSNLTIDSDLTIDEMGFISKQKNSKFKWCSWRIWLYS